MKTNPTPKENAMEAPKIENRLPDHAHVPSFWSKCGVCGESGVYSAGTVRVLEHEVQVGDQSFQRCTRAVGLARCTAPAMVGGDCGRHQ